MMRAAFVPPAPAPAPPPPGRATTHRTRLSGTVAGVLAAHAAALWALHGAWSARSPSPPAPTVVQATLLPASSAAVPAPPAASVEAPAPPPRSLAAAERPRSAPAPALSATPERSAPPPPVVPTASAPGPADPAPAAAAALTPSTVASVPSAGPASTPPATDGSTAPAAVAPPARIDLPSASAAYLSNPPPPYPPLSRRLGEQGKVVVRVRIEADGTASAAEVRTSSGFERLDQAALQTVLRWKYVPGKRNGVPEAMWYLIPIQFVLE